MHSAAGTRNDAVQPNEPAIIGVRMAVMAPARCAAVFISPEAEPAEVDQAYQTERGKRDRGSEECCPGVQRAGAVWGMGGGHERPIIAASLDREIGSHAVEVVHARQTA